MAELSLLMRPLKRQKLGPPEWYPQDAKQSEDELSEHNVKKGYVNQPVVSNEHGSAKDLFNAVPLSKFACHFNAIQMQRQKINLFQDSSKRKPQINVKDNFWPVTARSKAQVTAWMQDLAGNKPLSTLGKKVPIFNKKEEIFCCLCDHAVPLVRATWFLKITAAYQNAMVEGKMKKRSGSDPSQEWTQALTRFLREQLGKLSDITGQSYASLSLPLTPDVKTGGKCWEYGIRLAQWLLEESLLDKQDFFHWLIELLERFKGNDDLLVKYILPLLLKHIHVILQTQTLSRMLATYCIRKLLTLNTSAEQMKTERLEQQTETESLLTRSSSPILAVLGEFSECHQHKSLVVTLSGLIQAITMRCPSALVWSAAKISTTSAGLSPSEGKVIYMGSPLDRLPCCPSELVYCYAVHSKEEQQDMKQLQAFLSQKELDIVRRSQAVERRWLSAEHQETKFVNKRLAYLEVLDQVNFAIADAGSNYDPLYSKLFGDVATRMQEVTTTEEKSAIFALLEWAVSLYRHGKHRALVAAKLISRLHSHLLEECSKSKEEELEHADPAEGVVLAYPLQDTLFEFLDSRAPWPGCSISDDAPFWQLVLLFGELIRHGVFSSNEYICKLIARGDLGGKTSEEKVQRILSKGKWKQRWDFETKGASGQKNQRLNGHAAEPEFRSRSYLELDKDLMQQHDMVQSLLDQDISPLDNVGPSAIFGFPPLRAPSDPRSFDASSDSLSSSTGAAEGRERRADAHLYFTAHFPLPEESTLAHDNTQRLVALFGVGKMLNEHQKRVTQLEGDVKTLFREADEMASLCGDFSIKLTKEEKEKKGKYEKKRSSVLRAIASLPSHEQYYMISIVLELMRSLKCLRPLDFGVSLPFPSLFQLAFLFDLFELSGDVQGLLGFLSYFVARREVCYSGGIVPPQTSLVRGTLPTKLLVVVSAVRKHYECILTDVELTCILFRGLLQTVENIADPRTCTSTERSVLSLLHDLYTSCQHLRLRYSDIFSTAYTKIRQAICPGLKPSNTSLLWDQSYLSDYFAAPRKMQLETLWTRHLSDDRPADIYSFVCSAIYHVNTCEDSERLYDVAIMCAEVTAHVTALSSEWLGLLRALCCSANPGLGFNDLLGAIEVSSSHLHEHLPVFVAILMARSCFTLEDLLKSIALPSLRSAVPPGTNWEEAGPGAKLSCHLLMKALDEHSDPFSAPFGCISRAPFNLTADHALLHGQFRHTPFVLVFQVLKVLLLLSDAGGSGNHEQLQDDLVGDVVFQSLFNMGSTEILESGTASNDLFNSSVNANTQKSNVSDAMAPLNAVSGHLLQLLHNQSWIKQRFQLESTSLLTREALLDPKLSVKQAKCLIRLCTVTDSLEWPTTFEDNDLDSASSHIIQHLNHWSLQSSLLELQLMSQHTKTENVSLLFDSIAKSVMAALMCDKKASVNRQSISPGEGEGDEESRNTLIGPLIAKLPHQIQGRILKAAADIMERGKWWTDTEKSRLSSASQKTLFNLILSCLKGEDENKAVFLNSLKKQLASVAAAPDEEKFHAKTEAKNFLLNSLNLRLNLVGAVFDEIQSSADIIGDWVVALFRLLTSGVVPYEAPWPYESMYYDLFDMTSVLLCTVYLNESSQGPQTLPNYELPKYNQLTQRLWRDLVRHPSGDTWFECAQLLPLRTSLPDIPTVEPILSPDPSGAGSSTPLNKSNADGEAEAEQGLKAHGLQHTMPWDLLEDHKSPAPMAWSWFGAMRIERKPLRYLEQARRLVHHTHQRRQPLDALSDGDLVACEGESGDLGPPEDASSLLPKSTPSPGPKGGPDQNASVSKAQPQSQLKQQQRPSHSQPSSVAQQQTQGAGSTSAGSKRARGRAQRQGSHDMTVGSASGLTLSQQRKMQQMLLQQSQQSAAAKALQGQAAVASRTTTSSFSGGVDNAKAVLHSRITAKAQNVMSGTQMPQGMTVSAQQSLVAFNEQLLRKKQQQQQQQQQHVQQQAQDLFTLTGQDQRLMGQTAPPNVQMPPSHSTPLSSAAVQQTNLLYSSQPIPLTDYTPASQLRNPGGIPSQQLLHAQYPPTSQMPGVADRQLLQPPPAQGQSALHQLLRAHTPRGQLPGDQALMTQRILQRRVQQQQQTQAAQQQQQQGISPPNQNAAAHQAMMRHMQRVVKDQQIPRGLQSLPRQLSAGEVSLQQQLHPEMPLFQRQVTVSQNDLQQLPGDVVGTLAGMMPGGTQQYSVGSAGQYPPPSQF